jgi:hypothetical protein
VSPLFLESEFLSPAFGNGFLKGFDPEEPPGFDARELTGLFLVELLGFLGFPELLSLLMLNICAKIVNLVTS